MSDGEQEEAMDEGDAPAEVAEEDAAEEGGEDAGEEACEEADDAAANADEDDEGPVTNMLEPLGDTGKFVVRQRQRLKTAALADAFASQILEKTEELRAQGKALIFEDFDISENRLPADQFEGIVSAMSDGDVHIERFRAFGCPTLDDQAATMLAGWLAGVTAENVPFEIHLSDCAITADGFRDLMKALHENDAFPAPDPRNPNSGKKLPLYLRLEHNYIEDAAMQESINSGIAMKMKKKESIRFSEDVKVRLLVREDGGFNQKKGDPPAPEDVPPPRPYRGKGGGKGKTPRKGGKGSSSYSSSWSRNTSSQDSRKGGTDSWRSGGSAWGSGARSAKESAGKGYAGGRDAKPPWQALPAPDKTTVRSYGPSRASTWSRGGDRNGADSARRSTPAGSYSVGATRSSGVSSGAWKNSEGHEGGGSGRASPNGSWAASSSASGRSSVPYNAFAAKGTPPAGDRGGNSRPSRSEPPASQKRSSDRDDAEVAKRPRTSPGKGLTSGGKAGAKGGGSSGGKGTKLPFPWEEHWSDEYNMNYFWNSKTGESSWERPKSGSTGARSKGGNR